MTAKRVMVLHTIEEAQASGDPAVVEHFRIVRMVEELVHKAEAGVVINALANALINAAVRAGGDRSHCVAGSLAYALDCVTVHSRRAELVYLPSRGEA